MTNIPHITEIFSQLYTRYKKLGFEIYGSYSPFLKLKRPSNYVVKKNKLMCTSGGITNDEMFIMYSIMSSLKPKNILIIVSFSILVLIWGITGLFFSDAHGKLITGYNELIVDKLVSMNWIRTFLWTLKMLLLSYILYTYDKI